MRSAASSCEWAALRYRMHLFVDESSSNWRGQPSGQCPRCDARRRKIVVAIDEAQPNLRLAGGTCAFVSAEGGGFRRADRTGKEPFFTTKAVAKAPSGTVEGAGLEQSGCSPVKRTRPRHRVLIVLPPPYRRPPATRQRAEATRSRGVRCGVHDATYALSFLSISRSFLTGHGRRLHRALALLESGADDPRFCADRFLHAGLDECISNAVRQSWRIPAPSCL